MNELRQMPVACRFSDQRWPLIENRSRTLVRLGSERTSVRLGRLPQFPLAAGYSTRKTPRRSSVREIAQPPLLIDVARY